MRIGFVQTSPVYGRIESNVSRAVDMIKSADADLLVLPELFSTGYLFPDRRELFELAEPVPGGPTCRRMIDVAGSTGTAIVFCIAEKSGQKLYDSAVFTTGKGDCAVYRKLHLFSGEKSYFDPGDLPLEVHEFRGLKLGMMVCFDWVFPEVCRVLALKGAHVVCHPSNLVLHYCQEVMRARSIENRIFTITANRVGSDASSGRSVSFTGCSQITDPRGELLSRANESSELVQVVDVDLRHAESKLITEANDVLADRRPEYYGDILSG